MRRRSITGGYVAFRPLGAPAPAAKRGVLPFAHKAGALRPRWAVTSRRAKRGRVPSLARARLEGTMGRVRQSEPVEIRVDRLRPISETLIEFPSRLLTEVGADVEHDEGRPQIVASCPPA